MRALHMNMSKVRHGMNVLDNRVMQKVFVKMASRFEKRRKNQFATLVTPCKL